MWTAEIFQDSVPVLLNYAKMCQKKNLSKKINIFSSIQRKIIIQTSLKTSKDCLKDGLIISDVLYIYVTTKNFSKCLFGSDLITRECTRRRN